MLCGETTILILGPMKYLRVSLIILSMVYSYAVKAQPSLRTRDVITGLDTPWEILWGRDNQLWVTERPGRVSRVNPQTGERKLLLTITDVFESDNGGLLGMVQHPMFPDSSFVFFVYTYQNGANIRNKIVRYTYSTDTLLSPRVILSDIFGNTRHDGGRLIVAPDNTLFMCTGDAHSSGFAQNHSNLAGKTLHMNLDGTPAADNPHLHYPYPYNLIWSSGHRNPQGLVFAPTGILYSSEHGQTGHDEVNIIRKGRNYGWPTVEGMCDTAREMRFCTDSNIHEPIKEWTPSCAPAGIDYYNHTAIPEWRNSLLLSGLRSASLRVIKLSGDGQSVESESAMFVNQFGRIRDVCIAPDGRVFLSTSNQDQAGTPKVGDDRIIELKNSTSSRVILANAGRSLNIFSNWSTDVLEVRLHLPIVERVTFSIHDVLGRIVYTYPEVVTNNYEFEIPMHSFASGTYILRARGESGEWIRKFVR
jgi:aldose sugar dehydrogenase